MKMSIMRLPFHYDIGVLTRAPILKNATTCDVGLRPGGRLGRTSGIYWQLYPRKLPHRSACGLAEICHFRTSPLPHCRAARACRRLSLLIASPVQSANDRPIDVCSRRVRSLTDTRRPCEHDKSRTLNGPESIREFAPAYKNTWAYTVHPPQPISAAPAP